MRRWRMWYVCATGMDAPGRSACAIATTSDTPNPTDGVHWERDGRVCIDYATPRRVCDLGRPCVVKDADRLSHVVSLRAATGTHRLRRVARRHHVDAPGRAIGGLMPAGRLGIGDGRVSRGCSTMSGGDSCSTTATATAAPASAPPSGKRPGDAIPPMSRSTGRTSRDASSSTSRRRCAAGSWRAMARSRRRATRTSSRCSARRACC